MLPVYINDNNLIFLSWMNSFLKLGWYSNEKYISRPETSGRIHYDVNKQTAGKQK